MRGKWWELLRSKHLNRPQVMTIRGISQVGIANGHYGQCHKDQKEDETFEIMHLAVILSIGAFFRRLLGEI